MATMKEKLRGKQLQATALRQVSAYMAERAVELLGARVFRWVLDHPGGECVISHDNGGVAVRFTVKGKPVDYDAFGGGK